MIFLYTLSKWKYFVNVMLREKVMFDRERERERECDFKCTFVNIRMIVINVFIYMVGEFFL